MSCCAERGLSISFLNFTHSAQTWYATRLLFLPFGFFDLTNAFFTSFRVSAVVGIWCRPLYGTQSRLYPALAAVSAAQRAASSVVVQQCNYGRICRLYEWIPRSAEVSYCRLFLSSRGFYSQKSLPVQGDIKKRELLKCVVAVKECIRGGGRHLQDVIFKHW